MHSRNLIVQRSRAGNSRLQASTHDQKSRRCSASRMQRARTCSTSCSTAASRRSRKKTRSFPNLKSPKRFPRPRHEQIRDDCSEEGGGGRRNHSRDHRWHRESSRSRKVLMSRKRRKRSRMRGKVFPRGHNHHRHLS